MLRTIILICATSTAPQDCTRETAIDVVRTAPASTPTMCGFFGQAAIAPTNIAPKMGESYQKIVCERARTEAAR